MKWIYKVSLVLLILSLGITHSLHASQCSDLVEMTDKKNDSHDVVNPNESPYFYGRTMADLPSLYAIAPLTDPQKEVIRRHPISKMFLPRNTVFDLVGLNPSDVRAGLGEKNQVQFVYKILKHVFPLILFKTNLESSSLPKAIYIDISDSYEVALKPNPMRSTLEMLDLKLTNSTLTGWRISSRHNDLNLPDIASIYYRTSFENGVDENELTMAVQTLKNHGIKKIIFSGHYGLNNKKLFTQIEHIAKNLELHLITIDDNTRIDSLPSTDEATIYYNSTRQKLPWLFALSSIALVWGPINLFEPLSMGNQVFALKDTSRCDYCDQGYSRMHREAEVFPNMRVFSDFQTMYNALMNFLDSQNHYGYTSSSSSFHKSLFDVGRIMDERLWQLLNRLQGIIERQTSGN